MEEWLEVRGLSSKQLLSRGRGEDLHVPLVGAEGRHVVRMVTAESLAAYRNLPSSMKVHIVSTSRAFVAPNGRLSVYVDYLDASAGDGELPCGLSRASSDGVSCR